MQSHLLIVYLNCWDFGVLFIKLLPRHICASVFPIFSWSNFTPSDFMLRSLINFTLILVWVRDWNLDINHLLMRYSFSPMHILGFFVKNQMTVAYGFLCESSILFHFLPVCFCSSTMLFLLLWLCSIARSQVLWYLQHCSFCSEFFWLYSISFVLPYEL
jgi:hypothetical protein